jgi:hypothetical protein
MWDPTLHTACLNFTQIHRDIKNYQAGYLENHVYDTAIRRVKPYNTSSNKARETSLLTEEIIKFTEKYFTIIIYST